MPVAAPPPPPHARSDSAQSSSAGSSYQLILDHILTYPGSYEIPLRTMYTLNCAPRAGALPARTQTPSSSTGSSPTSPQGPWQDNSTAHAFQESLMHQIAQLPNQPTSLPPSFITSFVHRCFPPELVMVDFPQALTGLDYLKDLETRRRREVAAAMDRLDIDRTTLEADGAALAQRYPGVMQWVASIEQKERKIEALYTQLYVGLRRWLLLNEMCLTPFNKHNCVAMLNTLYPPVTTTQPTSALTPAILKQQRDGFFKYIQSVEKSGTRVLNNLMQQGKAASDETGWTAVYKTIGAYLQLANSMIHECGDISNVQSVSPRRETSSRQGRKVDSGVSFEGSTSRPSTSGSQISDATSQSRTSRPKTPSSVKSGTALEKIAREFKRMGISKTNVAEMAPFPPAQDKPKTLRKMRSMNNVAERKQSPTTFADRNASVGNFQDPKSPTHASESARRQRMRMEAGQAAAQKFGKQRTVFELE